MTRAIGFIPLRKGSKGIIGKNKRNMLGRPLFCWVLTEAIFSNLDEVYVYTDDDEIRLFIEQQYAWTSKIKVLDRSAKSASDTASTESAILEFCSKINYDFDVFCLLQATSPLTKSQDINTCLNKIKKGHDSVLTVVKTNRFSWHSDGTPANYDHNQRPRRQDFEGLLVENGAVYVTTKSALQESKNRISGDIELVEMPENTYTEIDSISDWDIVERSLISRQISEKQTSTISHLVLDVDGVFTDGSVLYSEKGELAKRFDMRDGMGLEIIRQQGIKVIVMTSENSGLVKARMDKLKIENVYFDVKDKFSMLKHFSEKENINMAQIAYVGDDVNDLANLCTVGWSFVPSNAMQVVKDIADINLTKPAGNGAIREVCDFILKYNKRYE